MSTPITSIQQWIDSYDLSQEGLQHLKNYIETVSAVRVIAELAEMDVLEGSPPLSVNPIYQAAYAASLSIHSIKTDSNDTAVEPTTAKNIE